MSFTIPNTFGSQSGNVPSTQLDDNFQAVKNWADAPDVPTASPGDSTTKAASTAFVAAALAASPIGANRNKFLNGNFVIDQRSGGGAVTPAASAYVIDRFQFTTNVASKLTFQQVTDAPPGFKYSMKVTVASSYTPGAGDFFTVKQKIEGLNCIDLAIGTAAPAIITISGWFKGSVPGTYGISLSNSAANRTYVGTVSVSAVWAKQTLTLTLDNTGTWLTDNGVGLDVRFDLGSGSNSNSSGGAWQAGSFTRTAGCTQLVAQVNGASLQFAGLQLEKGAFATSFEELNIGLHMNLLQRYYEQIAEGCLGGLCATTVAVMGLIRFNVLKRSGSIVVAEIGSLQITDSGATFTAGGASAFTSGQQGTRLLNTTFVGLTVGRIALGVAFGTTRWSADCEL